MWRSEDDIILYHVGFGDQIQVVNSFTVLFHWPASRFSFILFYVSEYFVCIYTFIPVEEGIGYPESGVTSACEPPGVLWESNLSPLTAKFSLQPYPKGFILCWRQGFTL